MKKPNELIEFDLIPADKLLKTIGEMILDNKERINYARTTKSKRNIQKTYEFFRSIQYYLTNINLGKYEQ